MFRLPDATEPPTDRELIERTLGGEGEAFALLVDRFQRKVYRVAFAIVRDESEADTITQDTFVQAYTKLGAFEGRCELETWLTRIAINRCRDYLRRRRFVSLFSRNEDGHEEMVIEPVDERPDPERQFMAWELRRAIRKAEGLLSAQQKIIFRLRHYQNLSLEDIAGHLGLQAATVRVHLFRAVQKIRKQLSGWRHDQALQ
ncbi:MAG TPA: sigma-70 family RNA polymerase sigma factor [Thermoanaerobaculia bacterium]|nr:sigma-70 family RNA polymerase sigma factor [Thermoanaerobaculia bacterium]